MHQLLSERKHLNVFDAADIQVLLKFNSFAWFSYIVSLIQDIGIDWKGGIWRLVWYLKKPCIPLV